MADAKGVTPPKAGGALPTLQLTDLTSTKEILVAIQNTVASYDAIQKSSLSGAKLSHFGMSRKDTQRALMEKAIDIPHKSCDLSGLEAICVALLLTTNLEDVDRIPVTLFSRLRGEKLRHEVLFVRAGDAYGTIGQSYSWDIKARTTSATRPEELNLNALNLPFACDDVLELFSKVLRAMGEAGLAVEMVHFGLPVPHDLEREVPIRWNYMELDMTQHPMEVSLQRVERYAMFLEGMATSWALLARPTMQHRRRIDLILEAHKHVGEPYFYLPPRRRKLVGHCEGRKALTGDLCVDPPEPVSLNPARDALAERARTDKRRVSEIVLRLTKISLPHLNEHRHCACEQCENYRPVARRRVLVPTRHGRKRPKHTLHRTTLRVLSFDVTSPTFVRPGDYAHCPPECLPWEYRMPRLIMEILSYDADIMCFQGLDERAFWDDFKTRLGEVGYTGTFEGATGGGGCATFFRDEMFSIITEHGMQLRLLAEDKNKSRLQPGDLLYKACDRVTHIATGNVGQCTLLREKKMRTDTESSDRIIAVANTHLFSGEDTYRSRQLRLMQMSLMLEEMERFIQRQSGLSKEQPDWPLLLCGDLACTPTCAVCGLLEVKSVPTDHPDLTQDGSEKQKASKPLGHAFEAFNNAYVSMIDEDADLLPGRGTSFYSTRDARGTRLEDYVFYSVRHFRPVSLLGLPLEDLGPLPNARQCSAHLAVMAEFERNQVGADRTTET